MNEILFSRKGEQVNVSSSRYKFLFRPVLSNFSFDKSSLGFNSNFFKSNDEEEFTKQEKELLRRKKVNYSKLKNFPKFKKEETNDFSTAKDVSIQTIYRENDVQTDPFTPPVKFIKRNKEDPSKLYIDMEINEVKDIDVDADHLKIIDRKRRRKKIEENLPEGLDQISFKERVRRLKTLEFIEWQEREEEIAEKQRKELLEIKKKVLLRHKVFNLRTQEKIKKCEKEVKEKLQKRLNSIEKKKFHKSRIDIDNIIKKRDIIIDTLENTGKYLNENSSIAYEIKPALLSDTFGISEIENMVQKEISSIDTVNIKKSPVIDMNEIVNKIDLNKTKMKKKMKTLRELYKATPRFERPPTPELIIDSDTFENEELNLSIIYLQKRIRGKLIQEEINTGKNKTLDLIRELQAVEKVKEEEKKKLEIETEEEKLKRKKKMQEKKKKDLSKKLVQTLQGEIIARSLDYLSKEMIRHRDLFEIEKIRVKAEANRLKEKECQN